MTGPAMIDYKNLTAYESLLPCLKVIVDVLLEQGFRVFVEKREERYREVNTARVCLDFGGPFAQVGTWRLFSYVPMLSVPIKSQSKFGWGDHVPIECDSDLDSVIDALKTACSFWGVTATDLKGREVTTKNYGKRWLEISGAYSEGFVEIAPDKSDREVEL